MGRYSVPLEEQETIVHFNRDEKHATIYTSDSTMMTKLDRLCNSSPDFYKVEKTETVDGDIVSKCYKVMDKNFISFRSKKVVLNLTDEQKKERAERLRNSRNYVTVE